MASKAIHFRVELTGDLEIQEANLLIYRVSRSTPERLEASLVHDSAVELRLPIEEEDCCYVVAELRKLRLGDQEVETEGRALQMVSAFTGASEVVTLGERCTVATSYAFARFLSLDEGEVVLSDPEDAFAIAYGMKNHLMTTAGELSDTIRSSPNGFETNSYALFNFLSNLVYESLISPETYAGFLRLTATESLVGALLRLPQDPFLHVEEIYALVAERPPVFTPSMQSLEPPANPIPDHWALAVKVNDSGAQNFLIAGVGYADFDKNDRLWLTNNFRQGTPYSGTFCVILEPDGRPASFSPLFGGGLLGAGFGVATGPKGDKIYFGSYGWGPTECNPQHGAVAAFSCDGKVLSPANGYTKGLSRVQGLGFCSQGHLWMCSWGTQDPMPPTNSKFHFRSENSAIVVYLDGDPERVAKHRFENSHHMTFDVAFDAEGHAYVTNSGYKGDESRGIRPVASSVHKFRVEDGQLVKKAHWTSPKGNETFRQVAVHPNGDVYVGAVETRRVLRFSRDLEHLGTFENKVYGPWGLGFDREGTMYLANFARDAAVPGKLGPYGVTIIRDNDESSAQLLTLPTGGQEVTLANGLPLYGNPQNDDGEDIGHPSFDPLMRLTATRVDRAGNLWACNNWKPSAVVDAALGNPGGDGMVIFLGVAAPAGRRFHPAG